MGLYELMLACVKMKYEQVGEGVSNFATRRVGETLYVFFEGSDGEADWGVNLDFPASAYKRGGRTVWYAHRGFLEAWKATAPYLSDDIMEKSIKKVVVAGYSHGAAIALLCHEFVWYNRPDLRDVTEGYGFACPRVYWGAKNSPITRRWARFTVIRNAGDIVTHLPPAILGYSHVGKMLEMGARGRYSPMDAHRAENILRELRTYEKIHQNEK